MLNTKQQKLILFLHKNNGGYVSDIVPKMYSHYSSFYRATKTLKGYITKDYDIIKKQYKYRLNINGFFLATSLVGGHESG